MINPYIIILKKQIKELYIPKTAFGNVRLIHLIDEIQKLFEEEKELGNYY